MHGLAGGISTPSALLARRLAAVLKAMKADGSLERFRREVKYELTGQ